MHFGIGWRQKSSLLCSSCTRACCQHPAPCWCQIEQLLTAAPISSWKKITVKKALAVPGMPLSTGFVGVSEGCWANIVKEWSFIQKAFGCSCSSPWLWKDNCNQRQFFIMDKRIMRYKRVCTRKFINYWGLASVMGRSAVCSLCLAEQAGSCTVFVTDQKQQPFDRCHVDLHLQIHPSEKHLCA